MKVSLLPAVLAACLMAAALGAQASPPLELTSASFMDIDGQLKAAKGHPNEEWRLHGLKSYQSRRYEEAVQRFERAASYADKYSQHYLSLIYWRGQGVPPDRVRAYIWSDLAAERGSRQLLTVREKMWAELTPEERARVVQEGAGFYDRYGDAVAKPRAEAVIRRFARSMTGSRTGFSSSNIEITQGGPMHGSFGNATPGMMAASQVAVGTTDEDRMYARERTNPSEYWRAQDWGLEKRGYVEVGPISVDKDPH